jgi:hypothetical protein
MPLREEIKYPFFNFTEKKIICSALEEATESLRKFYCFSPREWFNFCYDLKTELEGEIGRENKKAFAEVRKYPPILKNSSLFSKERYQICLFDHNILRTLWNKADVEFFPFMTYILTHELIHIARFSQDLHPFECDEESLQKEEEERVNKLTKQVLNTKKSKVFDKLTSFAQESFSPSPASSKSVLL